MFVPITLQFARGLRHKTVIPIFNCLNLEIALTVLSVAEKLKTGLIICVDLSKCKSNWHFIELLSYYIEKSKSPVSVILMDGTEDEYKKKESYLGEGMSILDSGKIFYQDQDIATYHKHTGLFNREKYSVFAKSHKINKLPQIIEAGHINSTHFKELTKAGVVGFLLRDELNMAYTAGLRSALRDRSRSDPEFFRTRSLLAVEKIAQSYLTNFQFK